MTHRSGASLSFDEMILGARHALAGGQEFFSVTPDMATFGKAFGAGRKDMMQHAWPISGTYSGDTIGLAACQAMLQVYEKEHIIDTLHRNGTILWKALGDTGQVTLHGHPPHFQMRLTNHDQRIGMSYFVQQCAKHGLLFHPQVVNASGVMAEDEVTRAAHIAANVLERTADMTPEKLLSKLTNAPYKDSVRQ